MASRQNAFRIQDQAPDARPRPSAVVVSHERSGTHFLINALARAYGYPQPPLNFDWLSLKIDYANPRIVAETLGQVGARPTAAVVKSHHAVEFFDGVIDTVVSRTPVFYIHRDPVDVMVSYWRFIRHWTPTVMPAADTVLAFAAGRPEGAMSRYQKRACRSVLERWAQHVDGWTAAATRTGITVVRYEQLKDDYAAVVAGLAGTLGPVSGDLVPPPRDEHVVGGASPAALPAPDRIALRALALADVGDTMRRHGYA